MTKTHFAKLMSLERDTVEAHNRNVVGKTHTGYCLETSVMSWVTQLQRLKQITRSWWALDNIFFVSFYEASWIGEPPNTPTLISRPPLRNDTTWPKRGGRTTSHFGDGVSFYGATLLHFSKSRFWRQSNQERKHTIRNAQPKVWNLRQRRTLYAPKVHSGRKYEFYASEMSPGLPCNLRNWQRLQLVRFKMAAELELIYCWSPPNFHCLSVSSLTDRQPSL